MWSMVVAAYQDIFSKKKEVLALIERNFEGITPLVDDFSLPKGRSVILYHKGHPVGFLKSKDLELARAINSYVKNSKVFIGLEIKDLDRKSKRAYEEIQDAVAFDLHEQIDSSYMYRGKAKAKDLRVANSAYRWNF